MHAAGIDEPRLIDFARELAAMGHPVVTAELSDLARYQITPRTTDMIEDAAAGLPSTGALIRRATGPRQSWGSASPAACRSSPRRGWADESGWVLSFGGHGDLPRTLRYLCTGMQPDGRARPPHDYGVVIILLGVADRVVPAEQVEPLRQGILAFLNASHLDMVDKPRAALEFERAQTLAETLPEPARTLMTYVNNRDVAHLGPALLPHVAALGGDPALSPVRNPAPVAPVYLLHGADDNVIPAAESETARRRSARARRARDPARRRRSSPTPRSTTRRRSARSGA